MSDAEAKAPEATPAAPAAPAAPEGTSAPAAGEKKPMNPWIPVAAVAVLCPLLSFAILQFMVVPKIEHSLKAVTERMESFEAEQSDDVHVKPKAAAKPAEQKPKEEKKADSHGGGAVASGTTYEFKDIISNLAGSLQSRYIKVSFMIEGVEGMASQVEAQKPKMVDATLSVLANLTLKDLDQPGIKNIVRSDLLGAYEAIFHERIVTGLYFSEFVIQ